MRYLAIQPAEAYWEHWWDLTHRQPHWRTNSREMSGSPKSISVLGSEGLSFHIRPPQQPTTEEGNGEIKPSKGQTNCSLTRNWTQATIVRALNPNHYALCPFAKSPNLLLSWLNLCNSSSLLSWSATLYTLSASYHRSKGADTCNQTDHINFGPWFWPAAVEVTDTSTISLIALHWQITSLALVVLYTKPTLDLISRKRWYVYFFMCISWITILLSSPPESTYLFLIYQILTIYTVTKVILMAIPILLKFCV